MNLFKRLGNYLQKHKYFIISVCVELIITGIVFGIEFHHLNNSEIETKRNINGLVSTVVAVIPLLISLGTEIFNNSKKIVYGLTINEFRYIRKDFHLSVTEMIIISFISFAICAIASYFNCPITLFVLLVLTFVFLGVFIVKELRVIMNDKKYIKKIIKKSYQLTKEKLYLYRQEKSSPYYYIYQSIKHVASKDGIIDAYYSLRNKDGKDCDLLSTIFKLLDDYACDYLILVKSNNGKFIPEFENENVIESTKLFLDNLCIVTTGDKDINPLIIGEDNKYILSKFNQMIIDYENVFEVINREDLFIKKISEIIQIKLYEIEMGNLENTEKENLVKMMNCLFVKSISNDKLWFCDIIRDSFVSIDRFANEKLCYFIFFAILLHVVRNLDDDVPDELKKLITEFISSPSNNLTGDNCNIKNKLKEILNFEDSNRLAGLLPDLLKLYKIFDQGPSHIYSSKKVSNKTILNCTFTKEVIIDCYMQIILNSISYCDITEKEINDMFIDLDDETQKEIAIYLNNSWFDNRRISIVDNKFAKFYGLSLQKEIFYDEEKYIYKLRNVLEKILEEQNADKINSIENNLNNDEEKVKEARVKLFDIFNSITSKFNIGKKKEESKKTKCYKFIIEKKKLEKIVQIYSTQIKNAFLIMLNEEIKKEKLESISIEDKETLISLINNSNFNRTNRNIYYFKLENQDDTYKKQLEKLELKELNVSQFLIWNDKSLNVIFESNQSQCEIRKFSDDELEQMIKDNYRVVDGLYKYESELNGKVYAYLPYEKLKQILENKYLVAVMSFNFYFEVGKDIYIVDSK